MGCLFCISTCGIAHYRFLVTEMYSEEGPWPPSSNRRLSAFFTEKPALLGLFSLPEVFCGPQICQKCVDGPSLSASSAPRFSRLRLFPPTNVKSWHFWPLVTNDLCALCDRNRPRTTRVNRRFLSRTVASAARSRSSHDRAVVPSASCTSHVEEETARHSRHTTMQQQQQKTDGSRHPQHSTASVRKADKRKRSVDSNHSSCQSSADCRQTNTYDVHEYMMLNKEYKLKKKPEQLPISRHMPTSTLRDKK